MKNLAIFFAVSVFFVGCQHRQSESESTGLVDYETYRGTLKHSDSTGLAPFHLVLASLPEVGEELYLALDSDLSETKVNLLADKASYVELFGYPSPMHPGLFEVKKIESVDPALKTVSGKFAKNTTAFDSTPYLVTDADGTSFKVLPESKSLNAFAKQAADAGKNVVIEGYFDANVPNILIAVSMVEG